VDGGSSRYVVAKRLIGVGTTVGARHGCKSCLKGFVLLAGGATVAVDQLKVMVGASRRWASAFGATESWEDLAGSRATGVVLVLEPSELGRRLAFRLGQRGGSSEALSELGQQLLAPEGRPSRAGLLEWVRRLVPMGKGRFW
jgi:hypothetical protein